MTRAMVCMPLGFGLAGEPTTIRYDGRAFDCIPFRVVTPGIRVVARGPSHHSLTQYPGDWDVMIEREGPLAARLREPVTAAEAERLLAILEASDLGGWAPRDRSHAWITEDAMRGIEAPGPEPICQLLRRARDETALSFGCFTTLQRLSNVTLAELAHALGVPPAELRGRLATRGGLWARL